ncbi:MAG: class I adenylate cyclase [Deltaproteobacteria bacterium]|nr:class I adenylate cyclase [Deltaproteobacteria bacterium]
MKTIKNDQHLKITLQLMKRWNLLPVNYKSLATLHTWQFKKQQETGKRVHAFLLATYTRLRDQQSAFQDNVDNTITQRDLSILGKKLFSFYENKPGKISYLHSLSRYDIGQQEITFHFSQQRGGNMYAVYQGRLGWEDIRKEKAILIHQEKDIVQLTVWLVINGIVQKKTQLHMVEHPFLVTLDDIQKLTDKLLATFPLISFSRISADEMLSNEKIIKALAVVNLHKEPVRGSKDLRSDIITQNNYGEYFVQRCSTLVQLKNTMRMLLTKYYVSRWNNNLDFFIPPQPEQHYIQNMLEKG